MSYLDDPAPERVVETSEQLRRGDVVISATYGDKLPIQKNDAVCKRCAAYQECMRDYPADFCEKRKNLQKRMDDVFQKKAGGGLVAYFEKKQKRTKEALRAEAFESTQDDVIKNFTILEAYETMLKRLLLETVGAIYDAKKTKVIEAQKTVLINCIKEWAKMEKGEEAEG